MLGASEFADGSCTRLACMWLMFALRTKPTLAVHCPRPCRKWPFLSWDVILCSFLLSSNCTDLSSLRLTSKALCGLAHAPLPLKVAPSLPQVSSLMSPPCKVPLSFPLRALPFSLSEPGGCGAIYESACSPVSCAIPSSESHLIGKTFCFVPTGH